MVEGCRSFRGCSHLRVAGEDSIPKVRRAQVAHSTVDVDFWVRAMRFLRAVVVRCDDVYER